VVIYFLLLLCAMSTVALAAKPTTAALGSPIRLALIDDELIAVTEFAQQKVLLLDARTHSVRGEIEVDGKPLGVAWGNGVLYVGNDTLDRIEIYGSKRNGKWSLLGTLGDKDQLVPGPSDIECDPVSGRIFALSAGQNTVFVFSAEGDLLSTDLLSTSTDSIDDLRKPTALAVNGMAEELYVSDYGDADSDEPPSVKIYDFAGNHLTTINGESGQSGYEFSRPQGLATTDRGEILLVDSLLGQVLVFDRISLLGLATLGSYGTQPGELRLPLDVVVDEEGEHVHVTNNRLSRIESFELEEDFE
jgi:DNA-binding beta-propeller fold protein YncE